MQLIGDIHNIRDLVKSYDERLDLILNPHLGKYQVVELIKKMRYEGDYQGHSLFSLKDEAEIAITFDFIDATKEAPDMRIMYYIRDKDTHVRKKKEDLFLEMEETSKKIKEQRIKDSNNHIEAVAKDYHKKIVREYEGENTKLFY